MTHLGRKDPPGPKHQPSFFPSGIDGVTLMKSPTVEYLGDNLLTELYRPEWLGVFEENEPIDHLVTVKAPTGGVRKEWYFHEHTTDRYLILSGKLQLGLYDARPGSETFDLFEVVTLEEPGGSGPNGIRIPPNVWHSHNWIESPGMFMLAKVPGYQPDTPDKVRVQLDDLPPAIKWRF